MAMFGSLFPDSLNYLMPWKTTSHHRLTGQSTPAHGSSSTGPSASTLGSVQASDSPGGRCLQAEQGNRFAAAQGSALRFPAVTVAQAAQRGCVGRRPAGRYGDNHPDGSAGGGQEGEPASQEVALSGGDNHRGAKKISDVFGISSPSDEDC